MVLWIIIKLDKKIIHRIKGAFDAMTIESTNQIGQEETAVILSIKPYQMEMIQGVFKVPSYIAMAEVSDNNFAATINRDVILYFCLRVSLYSFVTTYHFGIQGHFCKSKSLFPHKCVI